MKRPTSVSVIAWIILATSVFSLVVNYKNMDNPLVVELMAKSLLPMSLQYAMMYLGLVIAGVAAVAMLKGLDWGRKLYFGWSIFGMIVVLATSPLKVALIPGAVVLAIMAYFLYRPKANAYFVPQGAPGNA